MTTSSTSSRANTLLGAIGAATGIAAVLYTKGSDEMFMLAPVAVILLSLIFLVKINRRQADLIGKIKLFTQDTAKGNLESRITGIGNEDELGQIAWNFNESLDQVETCLRETMAFAAKVQQGDYNRKALPAGLNGLFPVTLEAINGSLSSMTATMHSLEDVMAGVGRGDFSGRMDEAKDGAIAVTVNSAIMQVNDMFDDVGQVMQHVSSGQFEHRVTAQGDGSLALLKNNINSSLDAIDSAIEETNQVAIGMAEGDLTSRITGTHPGRLGELKQALNQSIDKMQDALSNILMNANLVNTGAKEISQGSLQLSERTNEQAASLEETAASMNEMASTVETNATNAKEANTLVTQSRSEAEESVGVMRTAIKAMDQISQSSQKIADIITLIDGIAFQTNLLALNASVEAARAGEHGRGFAVVAGEVRTLSQKAAESAKEIRVLIESSNTRVIEGSNLVNQSGDSLQQIFKSIQSISELVENITTASQEQANSITQVNEAVNQLDVVNQQNAALVEESTAASDALNNQAGDLRQQISFFKVSDNNNSHQTAAQRQPHIPQAPARHNASRGNVAAPLDADMGTWSEF